MHAPYLEFSKVSKSFGAVKALDNLSVAVYPGESVAILGCNGAGKSTFMSLASGIRAFDSGSVAIFGRKPQSRLSRKKMRILPQDMDFPSYLKVREILRLIGLHYQDCCFKKLAEKLQLNHLLDRKTYQLSGGERRRLAIVCTLIGSPQFILLDEPTANIDLEGRHLVYGVIKEYLANKKNGMIFSSHQMQEVEVLADRVIILEKGKVLAEGSVKDIKNLIGLKKICFRSKINEFDIKSAKSLHRVGEFVTLLGLNSDEMLREVIQKDSQAFAIELFEPSLDEVFLKIWNERGAL